MWLDQADGQVLTDGEEVTLMDWGNAFIRVSTIWGVNGGCCQQTGCSADRQPVVWRVLWMAWWVCVCVCVCCAQ